ncbi:MAG: FRG domain-containing protein, partial [Gammaproteobacteria bacterium]
RQLRAQAKTRYRQFKQDAWPLLGPAERSEWGIVFTMQHYRLPTRLLDWTESFLCALFFAQQNRNPNEAAAIWVLDSEALNSVSVGVSGLVALDNNMDLTTFNALPWHPGVRPPSEELQTIAVSPVFTNARMTAQRAAFTLAGDSFLPIEEQLDRRLISEGHLVKIELQPDSFAEVEDYLRIAGVRAFTYFPDLEGLALDHERNISSMLREKFSA